MRKKIIGLDLDGVLVDTVMPVLELAERNTGLKAPPGERDWYFSSCPEPLRKEIQRLFRDDAFMNNCFTFHGVVPTLVKWKDAGYNVYIITARTQCIRENTQVMVERMFGGLYQQLYFVEIGQSKLSLLKNLCVDVWVDDSPQGAREASENGLTTYLIHNKYTETYNRCVIDVLPVIPIKVISDILF